MALTFTGTGGLFTRLGKIGKLLYSINGNQSANNTVFGEIAAQYASTLKDRYGQLAQAQTGLLRSQSGIIGAVQTLAQQTIIDMVEADQPAAARSFSDALNEVIRQMIVQVASVQSCSVGVSIAALGTPTGTGAKVYSTKRGDGLVQENMFAEVGRLVCQSDSYSGGVTAGREPFRYVGESNLGAGVFDYDWPQGSDANTSLSAVSADEDSSTTGNLLRNGDGESWTGSSPAVLDYWDLSGGVWATDLIRNASSPYRGTYDVKWLPGTAATPILSQTFNSSSGTTAQPKPLTSYALNCWMKRDGAVGAGVMTFDLHDGTSVINDQAGTANSFTQTLSALTTSYAPVNGVFRLPAILPATIKVRRRISTALTTSNVYMDDLCLTPLTAAYTGGPGLAVFSGATPFVKNDTWTVTGTNDRGSATYLATMQALFDRLFGMRQAGLLLPSSGSPTIADTLITA